MLKTIIHIIAVSILVFAPNISDATTRASDYVSANTYNNLYPYMNNTMRTQLNPGTNPTQSGAQINVLARTNTANATTRNVVARTPSNGGTASAARSATNSASSYARAATNNASARRVTARAATPATTSVRAATTGGTARAATTTSRNANSSARRVVARAGTTTSQMQSATSRTSRGDASNTTNRTSSSTATFTSDTAPLSSARCLADYTECMNDYCERENTEYNRCYCSAKLAQIDAQYQPKIDQLIKEILTLKNGNYWTDAEMNEYWMEMVGQYTGENSWENLEDALDFDWAGLTNSNVRGQQAFAMGHAYCVQHLRGCAYMQTNLRDAYRSEIARDCATYESSLQKLQNAAESLVESYK